MKKRLFDVVVSFTGFCLLIPVFLVIMFLIMIFEGETPFFIQERVGRAGKRFRLFKFRTMKPAGVGKNSHFEAGDASRITTLGRILRKTKLDELPQLLNVIKGDMSLVGPRPEVSEWTLVYPEKWKSVHSLRPGITDYASLEFHDEEDILRSFEDPEQAYRDIILPRKLALYLEYVNNRTFWGDLKILFKTIKTILIT